MYKYKTYKSGNLTDSQEKRVTEMAFKASKPVTTQANNHLRRKGESRQQYRARVRADEKETLKFLKGENYGR